MASIRVVLTTSVPQFEGAITTVAVRSSTVTGPTGPQGATGATGPQGPTGATGTAATIAVGTVTTGAPGSSATVTNAGTSSAAVFNFAIPQGATGTIQTQIDTFDYVGLNLSLIHI